MQPNKTDVNLRRKAIVGIAGLALVLLASVVGIGFGVVMPRFEHLERNDMRAKSSHLNELISAQVEKISAQVGTNAAWDGLYSFVQEPDPEFAATELGDQGALVGDVSSYIVLDTKGKLLYENGYDQEAEAPRTKSLFGDALLAPNSPIVAPVLGGQKLAGVVNVNGVAVLFSGSPVTNAGGDKPGLGVIIMARVLDSKIVAKLTDGLKADVTVFALNNIPANAPQITSADHIALSTSGSSIQGWLDIRDYNGNPVATGKVNAPRSLTAVGRQTVRDLTVSVTVACLLASFGLLYAVDRTVVRRLARLATDSAALDFSTAGSRVQVQGTDEIAAVAHGLNYALENLDVVMSSITLSVARVREHADLLDRIASEVDFAATANAREASHAAIEVGTITGRLKNVADSAQELSDSIDDVANSTSKAVTATRSANVDSEQASHTISELSVASTRIDSVVKLIGEIADQTNLLALNATIEAARAGTAGKGFAVVANEVKALANQTADGTSQITQQIQAIQAETERAVIAIASVANSIGQADGLQHVIADAVAHQSATMAIISRNTIEVSDSTQSIASSVASLASGAQNAELSAGELRQASRALTGLAQDLQESLVRN